MHNTNKYRMSKGFFLRQLRKLAGDGVSSLHVGTWRVEAGGVQVGGWIFYHKVRIGGFVPAVGGGNAHGWIRGGSALLCRTSMGYTNTGNHSSLKRELGAKGSGFCNKRGHAGPLTLTLAAT
jgi:hypothetical protein